MASSPAMSLATRCTSCGTIFKVVQDQLKVSEGWVRCGRCNEVFNALDGLFDLERDPPPQRPASAPPRAPAPADQAPQPPRPPISTPDRANAPTEPMPLDGPGAPRQASAPLKNPQAPSNLGEVPATNEDDALDSRWLLRSSSDGRSASERRSKRAKKSDFADARFPKDVELDLDDDSDFMEPEPAAPQNLKPRPMPEIKGKSGKSGKSSGKKKPGSSKSKGDGSAGTPSFVRRADRQAQWRHPVVRATLAGVALALLGMLGVQAGVAFRDEISAQYPQARPWVAELCNYAGCEIAPWRHIEDLAVDSVTLTRSGRAASPEDRTPDDASDAAYKLSVVLHNRAAVAIATPHVELSLTDSSGSLVSRRVLSPTEFGFVPKELPPGSNTNLQTRLSSTGGRIAGYTVELFYP